VHLRRRGIRDERVLAAMADVPRELFLPPRLRHDAYDDRALPIDFQQTISQPYIVALMTEALGLTGEETVLEIGTGSGYQTAVLCELAREVISIERHDALSAHAGTVLANLGYANVTLLVGDGSRGRPELAPFDRVIVTAAAVTCPPALLDQLRDGGTLVMPIGPEHNQILEAIHKVGDQQRIESLTPCRFVPLIASTVEPG